MLQTRIALLALLAPTVLVAQTPTRLSAFGPVLWIRMDTVSNWVLVPGGTGEVFRKTRHIYGTLKIKTDLADSTTGQLGSTGVRNTGAFAGDRMSTWIRCGETMTGPNADTWRVTIAILSQVERVTKDTTRLRTLVVSTAKNLAEGTAAPTPCTSSGQLESIIHKKVLALPPGEAPTG